MNPEILKKDIEYQISQLRVLEKELETQQTFYRLIDDIVSRIPKPGIEVSTIHVYGAGRSGLEARALAMRLTHLGYDVSEPGTATAKPVDPNDLAIFFSGSWNTLSTTNYARVTKKIGATTVAVTSHPEVAKNDCSYSVEIGGKEKLGKVRDYYLESIKRISSTALDPLGTTYEFKLASFKDILIHHIMHRLSIGEEEMRKRHVIIE